jgi:adenylate cyclase
LSGEEEGTGMDRPADTISYSEPPATDRRPLYLVAHRGTPEERRFAFYDRLEIGRYREDIGSHPGTLLVLDPTVSSEHCTIRQSGDGRCFIRDVSRNGTKVDGMRLVPNVEVEVAVGQVICIANKHEFLLDGDPAQPAPAVRVDDMFATVGQTETITITVLVGDIRDFTGLVRAADPVAVQASVRRLFHALETRVPELGGTVKEFRGDGLFAFWPKIMEKNQAVEACRASLELERLARRLARDPAVWDIPGFPLHMDWALATGPVTIGSTGDGRPTGLSVIGAPVVLAFRLEKYAGDDTGPIVACQATRDQAADSFEFNDLGMRRSKGFDEAHRVYALIGPR